MTSRSILLSRRKFLAQSLTAVGGVSLISSLSGCGQSPQTYTESQNSSLSTPKHGGTIRLGLIGGQDNSQAV